MSFRARHGIQLDSLDSGPFDKLRVPSLSRDFRRNDGNRGKLRGTNTKGFERAHLLQTVT